MHKLALAAMLLATTQGCVLGRSPTARHVAMAVDGALAAGGIALLATANRSSSELAPEVADGIFNSAQTGVGIVALVSGLVGLVVNVALAPDKPAPANPSRSDSISARRGRSRW